MEVTITRGVRNNNLTNIKKSKLFTWRGEIKNSRERTFCTFQTRSYGYRATFILLRRYSENYGCRTLAEHISRWAPPSENATAQYVRVVSNRSNYPESVTLDHNDRNMMVAVVKAMVWMECGVEESEKTIIEGYEMSRAPC